MECPECHSHQIYKNGHIVVLIQIKTKNAVGFEQ